MTITYWMIIAFFVFLCAIRLIYVGCMKWIKPPEEIERQIVQGHQNKMRELDERDKALENTRNEYTIVEQKQLDVLEEI